MRWFLFFVAVWSTAILGGCGGGQPTAAGLPVHLSGQSNSPTSVGGVPSVLVTVKTDYSLADQAIRFVQEAGDEDFRPMVTLVDQGREFTFVLPKGYRYTIRFADTPSIDEPAPYLVDLEDFSAEVLELPLFQFIYHP